MTITNVTHKEQINKAMDALETSKKNVVNAQYRLNYHFMAPVNWMNDPNGLIQHNGTYHMFYQHHPYSVNWGPMHWGHAVSTDLINWKHEEIALAPSESYDFQQGNEDIGCFSGSAVSVGEEIALIYTGHVIGKSPKEVQAVAFSKDGLNFRKSEKNPVILPPAGVSKDFRDPKVWKKGDTWYMVIGSSIDGNGAVPLFKSENLLQWSYMGPALTGDGTQGDMWECPDLFPIGNKHLLIVSPMNMDNGKNIIMAGEMDYENGRFTPESVKEIDEGDDFYAAQTFVDEKGRRILIAWMDTWQTDFPTKSEGWAGAMTIPREIILENGEVKFLPVDELKNLREELTTYKKIKLSPNETVDINTQNTFKDSYEMKVTIDLRNTGKTGSAGLYLRISADGKAKAKVYYDINEQELVVDTTLAGGKTNPTVSRAKVENPGDCLTLRLFMDTCSLEVLTDDGRTWITSRIYPSKESTGIYTFTENAYAIFKDINMWTLRKVID
ncbi:glycoside hydrolase family 32 protein [Halobacillus massiliensis]|uniref:glycoside hydrolase family 32 protein n=1 Tax=Halobacillus massiliensis TaxID=1926286 RepID=UPI0009E40B5B|nr:glycoside hydrolase family 32 protein [Halobacillus massiliensis]